VQVQEALLLGEAQCSKQLDYKHTHLGFIVKLNKNKF
jgi:hypothetical protein